ncbi:hypothetical protein OEZ86_002311 [Tetradesmus obliquus]|nr:hypothetical protein OEZ86_002311 [Tetradesmus obliquus]
MGSCRIGVHGQRPKHSGDAVELLKLLESLPCNTIECSAVDAEKGRIRIIVESTCQPFAMSSCSNGSMMQHFV